VAQPWVSTVVPGPTPKPFKKLKLMFYTSLHDAWYVLGDKQ